MDTMKILWRTMGVWLRYVTRGAWWEARKYWENERMLQRARRL